MTTGYDIWRDFILCGRIIYGHNFRMTPSDNTMSMSNSSIFLPEELHTEKNIIINIKLII